MKTQTGLYNYKAMQWQLSLSGVHFTNLKWVMELEKRKGKWAHPILNVVEMGNLQKWIKAPSVKCTARLPRVRSAMVVLKWLVSGKGDTKDALWLRRTLVMADHLITTGQTLWDADLVITKSGLFSRWIPWSVSICGLLGRHPHRPKTSGAFPWHVFPLNFPPWVPGVFLSCQH